MHNTEYTRDWIIENSVDIMGGYDPGVLTIRGLHYLLFGRGMPNTMKNYKRVVSAMEKARWAGTIPFETFTDEDRGMIGSTDAEEVQLDEEIDLGKRQVKAWMNNYSRNKWEEQEYYPEVFIEKKALLGVFRPVCAEEEVALGACKGYPSLTFLNEASSRLMAADRRGQQPVILYFGDYDPSGEDIPRSVQANLERFGVDLEVRRFALMEDQVLEWGLPPAPVKQGDSRAADWDGIGQVELDAIEPRKLQAMCKDAVLSVFDEGVHRDLMDVEADERREYRRELKAFVNSL